MTHSIIAVGDAQHHAVTEDRGSLVAQAVDHLTAKLAQQANFLISVEKALDLASSLLLCLTNWVVGKTAVLVGPTALASVNFLRQEEQMGIRSAVLVF